jgi:hypothetical protein
MQVNQPTAEQIKAIITWADRMGRFWRRELHSAWMDGNYQGNRDISSGLQQVRNEFGPEWLIKFNLKAAKAALASAPAPEPVVAAQAAAPAPVAAPVYKIVQTVEGRMVATRLTSIHAWAHANGRAVYNVARIAHLRPELQCQPHVQGLLGPMWDGLNQDGAPVIRYEDDQTYNTLSR